MLMASWCVCAGHRAGIFDLMLPGLRSRQKWRFGLWRALGYAPLDAIRSSCHLGFYFFVFRKFLSNSQPSILLFYVYAIFYVLIVLLPTVRFLSNYVFKLLNCYLVLFVSRAGAVPIFQRFVRPWLFPGVLTF